jgi:hypothetical protein
MGYHRAGFEAAPVYAAPQIAAEIVLQAHSGDTYWLYDTYNEWSLIGNSRDTLGWILSDKIAERP